MSTDPQQAPQPAPAQTSTADAGLLDELIKATPKTDQPVVRESLRELLKLVMDGVVTVPKNAAHAIDQQIADIDRTISAQLGRIVRHDRFQQLEGSWRGLSYLVHESRTGTNLKIRTLNASADEVKTDLSTASEFDQSGLFKHIYEGEIGIAGGTPYGAVVCDFNLSLDASDIDMARDLAGIGAAACCPFIMAPTPELFGLDSFQDLAGPRDLAKIFDSPRYDAWTSLRKHPDSRFLVMAMPRVLARRPYGSAESATKISQFHFEEFAVDDKGNPVATPSHDDFCWMNASYVLGSRLTDAFANTGWCTAIRGKENGGLVENLPTYKFTSDDGDLDVKCPTEIGITDRREKELSDLGFVPLVHYKNSDYAVFFGGETLQMPEAYEGPGADDANENAQIMARIPYVMVASRIAHYLKVGARDKVGSYMEAQDCEDWLNNWISAYVLEDEHGDAEQKAKYPLAEAKISVEAVPGQAGAFQAVAWLRPWLQMEELHGSVRMVTRLPGGGGS